MLYTCHCSLAGAWIPCGFHSSLTVTPEGGFLPVMLSCSFIKGSILISPETCLLMRLGDKNSTFLSYFSALPHFRLCVNMDTVHVTFAPPLWFNLQRPQSLLSNWHMLLNFNFHHLPTKYMIFSPLLGWMLLSN